MGILANVMPGVRALRAPLAAGLLLLLVAWICFEDGVPAHPTQGIWASVKRLEPLVSTVGTVGLLTFGAYVVGSLYLVIVPAFMGLLARVVADLVDGYFPGNSLQPWAARHLGSIRGTEVDFLFYSAAETESQEGRVGLSRPASFLAAVEAQIHQRVAPPMSKDSEERLMRFVRSRVDVVASDEDRAQVADFVDRYSDGRVTASTHMVRDHLVALARLARVYLEDWDTLPLTVVGTQPQLTARLIASRLKPSFGQLFRVLLPSSPSRSVCLLAGGGSCLGFLLPRS